MRGTYLGSEYAEPGVREMLVQREAVFHRLEDQTLYQQVAAYLSNKMVVGWFQGRMEFGPRALGNRSIIGDARSVRMQRMLNMKIKYRESFRPFAPAMLQEQVSQYFDLERDSPYMLLVDFAK